MALDLEIPNLLYRDYEQGYWNLGIQACFTWCLELLEDKLQGQVSPNPKEIPNDIIIDILTCLPLTCLSRCLNKSETIACLIRSSFFVATYCNRSTPVIAFCYRFTEFWDKRVCRKLYVNFTDAKTKKITTSTLLIQHSTAFGKPKFYGSFGGFLLFVSKGSTVHVWNPVSNQITTVKQPYRHFFYAVYVHTASQEYRFLFHDLDRKSITRSLSFYTYELSSNLERQVSSQLHHPPHPKETLPTNVNGALHWMVNDANYKYIYGGRSDCLHSIILYNVNSEEFCTIPHPGNQCGLIPKHTKMGLMEMEGKLALCDSSSDKHLVIWVMDDYEHKIWIKWHVVETELIMRFCGINHSLGSFNAFFGDFHMFYKELLLRVGNSELILYNLQSGNVRSVGNSVKKAKAEDLRILGVPHVSTLATI